jgi:hypothetical protein
VFGLALNLRLAALIIHRAYGMLDGPMLGWECPFGVENEKENMNSACFLWPV